MKGHRKQCVLLVEDSRSWQDAIALALREEYDLTIASSYGQAIIDLSRKTFDILIIDPSLPPDEPNFVGMSLLDEPMVKVTCPSIVILTAHDKAHEARTIVGKDPRISAFLPKGQFDRDYFLETMRRLGPSERAASADKESDQSDKKDRSLWVDGSFVIVLLAAIAVTVAWLSERVPLIVLPVAFVALLLIAIVIFVVLLRRSRDLSESETGKLLQKVVDTLPFLNSGASKRPPTSGAPS